MATTTTTSTVAETCTPAQRITKSLLGYGVLAGVVFEASVIIQGLTRQGFRIAHDDASLLANGPLGWIQVTTFLVAGVMTIAAAVGAHRAMASRWAPRLLGIYGAGLMAAGLLRADPADGFGPGAPAGKATHISWHGYGHLISAGIGFIALIAACFVVARYFSRRGRCGMAIYSRITGVAFLAGFAGVTTGSSSSARYDQKLQEVARDMETQALTFGEPDVDKMDDHIGDDLLRLIFIACHPVLSAEARTALTLRLIGGLTTHEIARAFLVPEPTIAQRIVRAKRTLADKKVPFEIPAPGELVGRVDSVLEIIYLIFNEGYCATSGEDWIRPELCTEALRLGRLLAGLMPRQIEVHGLVALMELQASRICARTGQGGEPILLADQDRLRWDRLLIRRGLAALERAEQLDSPPGRYGVQAEIAACHARATSVKNTDWERIAALYVVLAHLTPSPVVELNRAVAVGMAYGPEAGLEIADELVGRPALAGYVQLPAVRGYLLAELGRRAEARAEFNRAATLTSNARERALFRTRAAECEEP